MVKTKRVTDVLDEKVKARLILGWQMLGPPPNVDSSGSEHNAADPNNNNDDHHDSPSLSNLLLFLDEDDDNKSNCNDGDDSDSDRQIDYYPKGFEESLNPKLLNDTRDAFRNVLMLRVLKAMDVFAALLKSSNASLLRRNVMAFLRSSGYNAAICMTKWETSGGLTSGNYEFIDVITSDNDHKNGSCRYIIDVEFAGEFEIARKTDEYESILGRLPRVFVGKCENVKEIVKVMSDAARRSLKSRGLHIPPWRKNRYMQNKWLGPHRRTLLFLPTIDTFPTLPVPNQGAVIKCRSVGFDASIFAAATTRSR